MQDQDRRRDALRAFIAERNLTVNGWAKAASIPESTLRAFLNGTTKAMTLRTYERLARAAGVEVDELLKRQPPKEIEFRQIDVIGAVQAGAWVVALERDREAWYGVRVPLDPRYAGFKQFGLEVAGDSMNEIFPHGTVVACVSLIDLGRDPLPGEKVVCLRRGPDDQFEATIKELRVLPDGSWWLWPRSTNPDFQTPWQLKAPGDGDQNDDIILTALVVGGWVRT